MNRTHSKSGARRASPLAVMVLALAASEAAAAVPAATAQSGDGVDFAADASTVDARVLVESRDRLALHPDSNPLVIVGMAERDNDFRSGLNAARRGEFKPTVVNSDEAYERRRALFEGGAVFTSATARSRVDAPAQAAETGPKKDGDKPERKPFDTTWIGMTLAAIASLALFLTKGRA